MCVCVCVCVYVCDCVRAYVCIFYACVGPCEYLCVHHWLGGSHTKSLGGWSWDGVSIEYGRISMHLGHLNMNGSIYRWFTVLNPETPYRLYSVGIRRLPI